MDELVESVKVNGVLSPIVVRPHPEGGYEILSGHRRARACEKAGITEVPVVVKNLDDDTLPEEAYQNVGCSNSDYGG